MAILRNNIATKQERPLFQLVPYQSVRGVGSLLAFSSGFIEMN